MSKTEKTGTGGSQSIQHWLIAECTARLTQALEAMTAEACRVEWLPEAAPDPDLSSWWKQPLNFGTGAGIWVGASQSAWSVIGGRALKAAGIDEADAADQKSTYQEILTQALSAAAQAIGARLGREVVCQPGAEAAPDAVAGPPCQAEVRFNDGEAARAAFVFGDSLVEALRVAEGGDAAPDPPPAVPAVATGRPTDSSKTLDLLLEVELPVSISFGRAQLPLKDVLKLTTGSIVELNRSVSEPVEVIVNNCVIARGEVVVIEGNYGVRIQQIVSRQERLRNLN